MSFFDGINFWVSDAANDASAAVKAVGAGASAGAAVGGGGVTMDRDEMTNFLNQVKQTRDLCVQQVSDSANLALIKAPAEDQASLAFTKAAQTSRDARANYLHQQLDMYNELVAKLQQALGLTTEADEQAAGTVTKAAGGGEFS